MALGPFGAVLGAVIGHQFDSGVARMSIFGGRPDPKLVNDLFFPTTFRVMGHIAKADGQVSQQEIASARAIMYALHLDPQQTQAAMEHFTVGKQPGFNLDAALQKLRSAIAPYPELIHFFMEIQLQVSLAGNGLSELPRQRLRRAAQLLGVSAGDFARLESILRFRRDAAGADAAGDGHASPVSAERVAQAYTLLEADAGMSDEDVVKAYRRQMSRHHPDKLKANGLPDSMLERAKERTQQIQAAYELVRERRGMR